MTRKYTRWIEESADALTNGSWQLDPRTRVQVWTPAPPQSPATMTHLIACPTCHARVNETCRTTGGNPTANHGSRLAPRLCSCGSTVEARKRHCPRCAKAAKLQASRDAYARRKAARLATVTEIGVRWAGDEDEEGAA